MSTDYKIISSDSHVIEPWFLWRDRLPAKYKDRAPRLIRGETNDLLVSDDVEMPPMGTAAGVFRADKDVRQSGRWDEDVPAAAYDPKARMEFVDRDGIWGEVLYPTLALAYYSIDDLDYKWALLRAYNDWLAEFCSAFPNRLKGIAMVANEDPKLAAEELKRVSKMGMPGVMMPTVAGEDCIQYHERGMDPLWQAAVENNMSINIHAGTTRDKKKNIIQAKGRNPTVSPLKSQLFIKPMLNMIFGGVFERFPDMTFTSAENEAGWAAHVIERCDYEWKRYQNVEIKDFEGRIPKPPSEYFRKNIKLTFMRDTVAVKMYEMLGDNTLMFQTDFPHGVSTYPNSRQMVDDAFEGMPTEVRDRIAYHNAAELYGFEPMEAVQAREAVAAE
jgi:uncharacterized protein